MANTVDYKFAKLRTELAQHCVERGAYYDKIADASAANQNNGRAKLYREMARHWRVEAVQIVKMTRGVS